jgi:hypothetical protein
MPLQAQQLVTLAAQIAKVPGFVSQGGQLLNMILFELCDNYDFDVARQVLNFPFATSTSIPANSPLQIPASSGPYPLAANWLRADRDDVYYTVSGVRYVMIPYSLAEFNSCVQQAGLNAYPENYAVDNSPIANGLPPNMYVWPPAGGAYPVTAVYYSQMPDIATPETSAVIPWFPFQTYLLRRLTGELMKLANDNRAEKFIDESMELLTTYMKSKDDAQVVKTVTLDRRRFGLNFDKLKNTKQIGW